MRFVTPIRASAAVAMLALVACVDQPTGIRSPVQSQDASRGVSAAVINQAELTICKAGNQTGPTTFAIDFTVTSGGSTVASGTVNLAVGDCVVAASFNPLVSALYRVNATEQAPPANWALTNITWQYASANPPPPTVDIPNRTVTGLRMSNDAGVQLTFTNTFTPPPVGCTFTLGYWKNHPAAWPITSVTLGTVTYTQAQLLQIYATPPSKGNGLIQLAHQLTAAKLNIASGADPTVIAATVAAADALIGSLVVPPIGGGSLPTSATAALINTLDQYNSGLSGPGHCN